MGNISHTPNLVQPSPYLEKMSPTDSESTMEKTQSPAPGLMAEDLRSGNLEVHIPPLVENLQSGGLQHYPYRPYTENMPSGGLQFHDIGLADHSNKELVPPTHTDEINATLVAQRKIFGLKRRTFWLLVAILAVLLIGALVGGVVGGVKKHQQDISANAAGASAVPAGSTSSTIATPSGSARSSTLSSPIPTSTNAASSTSNATTSSAGSATTTALPFVSPARANPVDTDGNYFVNCNNTSGSLSSGLAYYKNLTIGLNIGHQPDDYVDVIQGSYVNWENGGTGMFCPFINIRVRYTLLMPSL